MLIGDITLRKSYTRYNLIPTLLHINQKQKPVEGSIHLWLKNSVSSFPKLSLACRKDLMLVFSMVKHELYIKFNCHNIMQPTKTKKKKGPLRIH